MIDCKNCKYGYKNRVTKEIECALPVEEFDACPNIKEDSSQELKRKEKHDEILDFDY